MPAECWEGIWVDAVLCLTNPFTQNHLSWGVCVCWGWTAILCKLRTGCWVRMYPLGISNSCGCLKDEEQVPWCAEGGKTLGSNFSGHTGTWQPYCSSGLRVQLLFAEQRWGLDSWSCVSRLCLCRATLGSCPVFQKFRSSPAWHCRSARELSVWVYVFHGCLSPFAEIQWRSVGHRQVFWATWAALIWRFTFCILGSQASCAQLELWL